mgnify:CR=1 FL=1|jgi:hypothetical protein
MQEFHYKPEAGPAEVARLVCGSRSKNLTQT